MKTDITREVGREFQRGVKQSVCSRFWIFHRSVAVLPRMTIYSVGVRFGHHVLSAVYSLEQGGSQ